MKVMNLLPSTLNKDLASKLAKPKSTKKGMGIATSASKVCFDIVPYMGDLPPIGSIVLESTPSPAV